MSELLAADQAAEVRGMRPFFLIWIGSAISIFGDRLTGFVLDVWILENTNSINFYTLGIVFITLPAVFITPLAGTLIDRWPRRRVMLISQLGSALCVLTIAILFFTDILKIWHIYLFMGLSAAFVEFDSIAFNSAVTLLVSSENLTRASGLTRIGGAIARLGAPVLAGPVLSTVHVEGVLFIDFISFLIGMVPLLIIQIPEVTISDAARENFQSLFQEFIQGWNYLREQVGLSSLVILQAVYTFISTIGTIMFPPLVLNLTEPSTLGVMIFVAGTGALVGGIVMSTWAGRQVRLLPVVCGCILVSGVEILAGGLRPSLILITITAFLFFLNLPLINGSIQVIFQKKVPPEMQGRVFALDSTVVSITVPLAALASGSIVTQVLEPLMAFEGSWANGIGQLVGTGPGRGIGLSYIILGFLAILTALVAYQYSPLMQIEQEAES